MLIRTLFFTAATFLAVLVPPTASMPGEATQTSPETPTKALAGLAPGVTPVGAPEIAFGIHGASDEFESEIRRAMGAFEAAGLDLPELAIFVHDSTEPCGGNGGLYSQGGDQNRVDVCVQGFLLVLHELAHAWEYFNVDEPTRRTFMALERVEVWNDSEFDHASRGVERAADTISWGIQDGEISHMSGGYYSTQLDGYELLTGTPSPRMLVYRDYPRREAVPSNNPVADFS